MQQFLFVSLATNSYVTPVSRSCTFCRDVYLHPHHHSVPSVPPYLLSLWQSNYSITAKKFIIILLALKFEKFFNLILIHVVSEIVNYYPFLFHVHTGLWRIWLIMTVPVSSIVSLDQSMFSRQRPTKCMIKPSCDKELLKFMWHELTNWILIFS